MGNDYRLARKLMDSCTERQLRSAIPTISNDSIRQAFITAEELFPGVALIAYANTLQRVAYVSDNSSSILGHESDFLRTLSAPEFVQLIHRDDIKGFTSCYSYLLSRCAGMGDHDRAIFYYRIVDGHGTIRYIEDQRMVLQTENRIFIHLFRDLTGHEIFNVPKLKIVKRVNRSFLPAFEYAPGRVSDVLTPREREIAQLTRMGLRNKEIANRLFVSVYTVKNHKQSLFRKLDVTSSLELNARMDLKNYF
ncbi:hypothetical protein KK083_09565 [Fulvivirgaceae bacterium PWU4]|uniref:HTH luxR-type domain-containing protein n=1 Tax=Chryseosolibacter histidini TaxID=2782349 RepID=A0AAP2DLH1_9BACT|nr:LuxR C-terminal-related transcriptional regulator [Chryseosolibacter histidini]MBT1697122.1 hypothetical protein [Chryseosolibacter histidini]